MKKTLALLLALAMLFALTAASAFAEDKAEEKEPVELIVFAAASMTETLTEIKDMYEEANPHVTITYNFDSSGTLKTQIQEGADCDLFISAGQKQMNQLDINADPKVNTDELDFVLEGSRIDLLENKVVLVVPEGNPKGIESFDQLAELLKDGEVLMAMGNSDVPVGQYTQKILAYYELNEDELAAAGKLTYGTNVKEVTTQVKEGSVDCGIVYCTDAFSAELTVIDSATAEMCGQVIYPAAVLNVSAHPEEAQAFLDYLNTEEAMAVFEKVGFSSVPLPEPEEAEAEETVPEETPA
ncbi:MAG: molybdate ABC transporter substrate-binding protein [Oscillospiraceae bacterium]|nr:molybdate ABC transporter substrate-binding protein [Oscillospiraceae bacterium]